MDDLRKELCIWNCVMGRLVKSRMKWAGNVERTDDDSLPGKTYAHHDKIKSSGRPRLRWVDCIDMEHQEGGALSGKNSLFCQCHSVMEWR